MPKSKNLAKRHPDELAEWKKEQKRKSKVASVGGIKGIHRRQLTGKVVRPKKHGKK